LFQKDLTGESMNNSYGTNILITKKDYLIKVQKEKTNDDMALSPILKKERKEKKKKVAS
jgi:hypothetical protein